MTTYRLLCCATLCLCLVFLFSFPWTVFFLFPLWVAFVILLWKVAMVAVSEPKRAVIFRLEVFHHIARSGYVFLLPSLDRIEREISSRALMLAFKVPHFFTADQQRPTCNLEVVWKISQDVAGRVSETVRAMVLMSDERRQTLVEQTVIRVARELALSYTSAQLKDNRVRDDFCTTLLQAANEMLMHSGLRIERIFWRGSFPLPAVEQAEDEGDVAEVQVRSMVQMIKTIRDELGEDVSAEDLYFLHEWLKLMREGGMPPLNRKVPPG